MAERMRGDYKLSEEELERVVERVRAVLKSGKRRRVWRLRSIVLQLDLATRDDGLAHLVNLPRVLWVVVGPLLPFAKRTRRRLRWRGRLRTRDWCGS